MFSYMRVLSIIILGYFAGCCYAMELDSSFSAAELEKILSSYLTDDEVIAYKPCLWKNINNFRKMVQSSLDEGISDIMAKHYVGGAIVEIGAGAAYTLRDDINKNIIRLQPNKYDFHELMQAKIRNSYPIDIAQFAAALPNTNKYIPLYLAINVFDTMSPEKRLDNLLTISQTQQSAGKIIIISDTNPWLNSIIPEINTEYSDMIVLPYLPSHADDEQVYRASAILVPKELINKKPINADEFYKLWMDEISLRSHGYISDMQQQLEWAQKEYDLKIIVLEDYYAAKITAMLKNTGYEVSSYYHTSFAIMNKKGITQAIIYKHVTESLATVRQWSHKDKKFIVRLKDKNLSLPDNYDDKFFADLLNSDQRLTGAELLVIEAKKI